MLDVSFGFLNFRSIKGKSKQKILKDWVRLVDLDIFAILESNLRHDNLDHGEAAQLTGYEVVCKDSRVPDEEKRSGGGVIVYAKPEAKVEAIKTGLPPKCSAVQYCKFKSHQKTITVIYRAPHSKGDSDQQLCDYISNSPPDEIIVGDFNLHDINWNLNTCPPRFQWFLNAIDKSEKYQAVIGPTHMDLRSGTESTLDLVISGDPDELRDFKIRDTWPFRRGSDHYMISFDLAIKPEKQVKETIKVYDYKRANFSLYRSLLSGMFLNLDLSSLNIDQLNEKITSNIKVAWGIAVPQKTVPIGGPPIDMISQRTRLAEAELRKLCKRRSRLTYDSHHLNRQIKIQQKQCRKLRRRDIIKEEIRIIGAQQRGETHIAKHFARFNKNSHRKPGPFKNQLSIHKTANDKEAADLLKDQYETAYELLERPDPSYQPSSKVPTMKPIVFKYNLIQRNIRKMKTRAAAGEDGILPGMLKEAGSALLEPLRRLFQASYDQAIIPEAWKGAVITPLYKSGKRCDPANYRPISVTSVILKSMEKSIVELINNHMERWNLWSPSQHGFLRNQSTMNNLLAKKVAIEKATINRIPTMSLYLDLQKAFDKVGYAQLIKGLKDAGMPEKTSSWYQGLLLDRHFRVKVGSCLSEKGYATSGAPQGLCSSPLLFNLAVNLADGFIVTEDISDLVRLERYADDFSAMIELDPLRGHEAAKKVIRNIETYCASNSLFINAKKTFRLITGKPQEDYEYYIDGKPIAKVDCVKDLGHMFQSNLKNNRGFDAIIFKMQSRALKIKKCLKTRDCRIMGNIWNNLISSFLLYDNIVLGRPNQNQLARLQAVQKRFMIGSIPCNSCSGQKKKRANGIFTPCLEHFGPQAIWTQILSGELKLMFKMSKGWFKTQFPIEELKVAENRRTRLSLEKGLIIPDKRHAIARASFIGRVSPFWNELPGSVRNAKSMSLFASGLKNVEFLQHLSIKRHDPRMFDHSKTIARLEEIEAKWSKLKFFVR